MNDLQAKSTNTLALCPFCGGEADVIDYDDECWVAHQCANGTSVETNSYETEAEAIAAWNSRAERPCSMTRADRLLEELNNDRRINKQLKMANALLRKSEAAKIERIEELEELARDLHADLMEYGCTPNAHRANYKPRFEALGIEVSEYETELPDWLIDESDD